MLYQGQMSNQAVILNRGGTVQARQSMNKNIYFALKRVLDIVLSAIALVVFGPLMLLVALAIKLDSKGPALFIQERVGARKQTRDGITSYTIQNFRIYKFRTMYTKTDDSIHRNHIKAFVQGTLETDENDENKFKLSRDPRITRVGAFLRKTSLDELPQLFNVLKGEMSLVGPRPVPVYEVNEYSFWHRERLTTLPGMTGLWQVEGRSQVSFSDMIRLDIKYLRNQSLWLDLKIILLTVPAVLASRGAR